MIETGLNVHYASLEQWQHMRRYTSRVTTLNLAFKDDSPSNVRSAYSMVSAVPPPEAVSPMFPKLKKIEAPLNDQNMLIYPMIKSPWVDGSSITRFDLVLKVIFVREDTLAFLASLGNIYLNVRSTSISTPFYDPIVTLSQPRLWDQMTCQGILGWKHLEIGVFHVLNTTAYGHLSRLESLSSLCFDVSSSRAFGLQPTFPPDSFPSLATFTLLGTNTAELDECISKLNHRRLSTIRVKVTETFDTSSKLQDLCVPINRHLDHQALQVVAFSHEDPISMFFHTDSLKPLFAFSNLQDVSLSPFGSFLVSDEELREIASSWPLMEVFDASVYIAEHDSATVTLPTFRSIFHLVEKWPRLRKLCLVIDARDIAWIDVDQLSDVVRNNRVSSLCLGNSPVNEEDLDRIVFILASTFRLVEELDMEEWNWHVESGWRDDDDGLWGLWKEVDDRLGRFRRGEMAGNLRRVSKAACSHLFET